MQLVSTTGNVPALPASSVLVCYNQNVADSLALANYYKAARGVPSNHLLGLNITGQQTATRAILTQSDYTNNIQTPIYAKIAALGGLSVIKFVVLGPFVSPIVYIPGISFPNASVASQLMTNWDGSTVQTYGANGAAMYDPDFASHMPSMRPVYTKPLVTHLDCHAKDATNYTLDRVKSLVDRSVAARPYACNFLIQSPGAGDPSNYLETIGDPSLHYTNLLAGRKLNLTESGRSDVIFASNYTAKGLKDLGGIEWGGVYQVGMQTSWGEYRIQSHTFLPGALAIVNNSLVWSRYAADSDHDSDVWRFGSSGIHYAPEDLIDQGITGGACTTDEPGAWGFTVVDVMWWLYRKGYTLAEAIWLATPTSHIASVLGDPLCAPWAS